MMSTPVDTWDVLVIGAGPAGALAARETARLGARTLLLDRAAFPRTKVCGGCLSTRAVSILRAAGLQHVLDETTESAITGITLACRTARATLPLNDGVVVRRDRFDHALARAAQDAGATFLDATRVTSVRTPDQAHRVVEIQRDGRREIMRAACVIIAAGLACDALLAPDSITTHVRPRAKIGLGAIVANTDGHRQGVIDMAIAKTGYVGAVPTRDGLIVAAAIDHRAMRASADPTACIQAIRRDAGMAPLPDLDAIKGTTRLTCRRTPLARSRLFLIGDSARYVEPFTGEGMTWAIQSALGVAPLAVQGASSWNQGWERQYQRWHRRTLEPKMLQCAMIARLLACPTLCVRTAALLDTMHVTRPLTRHFRSPRSVPV